MPWGLAAVAGGMVLSGAMQGNAASQAGNTQAYMQQAGIQQQQQMFNKLQANLQPYMSAGTNSLSQQQALLGLSGAPAQTNAINALANGPQMQALLSQGENAILQNASATGGLRGGNTQAALAQFRPQLLNQLINDQLQNIGNLTTIGQNAAAGVGTVGMNAANHIAQGYNNIGNALAGSTMGTANANANTINSISGLFTGAFSDRRLKKNIVKLYDHAKGYAVYAWEYLWGEKSIGVMADEIIKIIPDSVHVHPSGFLMVDYSKVEL